MFTKYPATMVARNFTGEDHHDRVCTSLKRWGRFDPIACERDERSSAMIDRIVLPAREGRCPALAICEYIGNDRHECEVSRGTLHDTNTEKCLASIVILLARSQGVCMEPSKPLQHFGSRPQEEKPS